MKAIAESGMDVGVQQQNAFLYVPLPRPSKAKREQLAKNAKVLYNRCHDQLREIMRCHEILFESMRRKRKSS
ncbi:Ribosome-recycling factor [Trichinella pseudospiralis]